MVTNWVRHWDDLASRWGSSTLYTLPVIRDNLSNGPWPEEAVTLFIKRSKSNEFEKSWIGITKNFRKDDNNGKPAIRFEVSDLQVIDCPVQFKSYSNGWHLNKETASLNFEPNDASVGSNLQPAFFDEMANCNWQLFEEHCFHLLRLLGIHDIHKFPQSDNRGKADGFFKFEKLSILYDATLETDFDTQKETQVDNYVNQLKGAQFNISSVRYTIKDTNKQVWIITRGAAVRNIRKEDDIKVKEIPYLKLIEVYHKRLNKEIGTEELWDLLKDLK